MFLDSLCHATPPTGLSVYEFCPDSSFKAELQMKGDGSSTWNWWWETLQGKGELSAKLLYKWGSVHIMVEPTIVIYTRKAPCVYVKCIQTASFFHLVGIPFIYIFTFTFFLLYSRLCYCMQSHTVKNLYHAVYFFYQHGIPWAVYAPVCLYSGIHCRLPLEVYIGQSSWSIGRWCVEIQ